MLKPNAPLFCTLKKERSFIFGALCIHVSHPKKPLISITFGVMAKRNAPIFPTPAKQIIQTNVPLAEQTRIQKVSPCGTTQITPAKRTNPLCASQNGEAAGVSLPQISGERSTGSLFIHAQREPHQHSMSEALECQWVSPALVALSTAEKRRGRVCVPGSALGSVIQPLSVCLFHLQSAPSSIRDIAAAFPPTGY